MWGMSDARSGCEKRRAVQLRELRGAGSKGSSIAADRRIVDEALTALSPEFEKLPPLATGGPPLWENQATPSQGGPAVRIRLPPRGVRDPGGRSPSRSRYTPRTG